MSKPETVRTRKPRARPAGVVIAVMEDRLAQLGEIDQAPVHGHVARLAELFDELKRSIDKDSSDE